MRWPTILALVARIALAAPLPHLDEPAPPDSFHGYYCYEGQRCEKRKGRPTRCFASKAPRGCEEPASDERGNVSRFEAEAPRQSDAAFEWWLQNGTAVRDEVSEHSLIFVAGAPNSGTSLLRTLISQRGLAHGQDSCVETTRCGKKNIEGQWLLRHSEWADSPVVTDVYKPGNLENHLTEKNATADALVTLWRLWARYWDMGRECLVEKSPANVGKIRWLAAVFAPAKRVRFLAIPRRPTTSEGRPRAERRPSPGSLDIVSRLQVVVKSPIAHKNMDEGETRKAIVKQCVVAKRVERARVAEMKYEADMRKYEADMAKYEARWNQHGRNGSRPERRPRRLSASTQEEDQRNARAESKRLGEHAQRECQAQEITWRHLFEKRMEALEEWTRVHEDLAKDLESWPGSTDRVGVVRYERLEATCACEGIIDFVVPPWSRTDAAVPPASGLSPLSRRPKERTVS